MEIKKRQGIAEKVLVMANREQKDSMLMDCLCGLEEEQLRRLFEKYQVIIPGLGSLLEQS